MAGDEELSDSALAEDELLNSFIWAAGDPAPVAGTLPRLNWGSTPSEGCNAAMRPTTAASTLRGSTNLAKSAERKGSPEDRHSVARYVQQLEAKVQILSHRLHAVHSATHTTLTGRQDGNPATSLSQPPQLDTLKPFPHAAFHEFAGLEPTGEQHTGCISISGSKPLIGSNSALKRSADLAFSSRVAGAPGSITAGACQIRRVGPAPGGNIQRHCEPLSAPFPQTQPPSQHHHVQEATQGLNELSAWPPQHPLLPRYAALPDQAHLPDQAQFPATAECTVRGHALPTPASRTPMAESSVLSMAQPSTQAQPVTSNPWQQSCHLSPIQDVQKRSNSIPVVAPSTSDCYSADETSPDNSPSVAMLVDRFVDNRRRRQHTIDAHLDEVEDALAQGDPVKFAFWSLDRDTTFFQDGGPAPRMLEVLGREIGLTADQIARLNSHRPAIRQDRETLARCQNLLHQIRKGIHSHIDKSSEIMDQIRKILSPVQVAKFFVWVEKHQHSVKTLTALWDTSNGCPAQADNKCLGSHKETSAEYP